MKIRNSRGGEVLLNEGTCCSKGSKAISDKFLNSAQNDLIVFYVPVAAPDVDDEGLDGVLQVRLTKSKRHKWGVQFSTHGSIVKIDKASPAKSSRE